MFQRELDIDCRRCHGTGMNTLSLARKGKASIGSVPCTCTAGRAIATQAWRPTSGARAFL